MQFAATAAAATLVFYMGLASRLASRVADLVTERGLAEIRAEVANAHLPELTKTLEEVKAQVANAHLPELTKTLEEVKAGVQRDGRSERVDEHQEKVLAEISATVASLPDIIQRESATARAVESERFDADERRSIRTAQRDAAFAYLGAVESLCHLAQMRPHHDPRSTWNSEWRAARSARVAARRMVRMVLPKELDHVVLPVWSPSADENLDCSQLNEEAEFAALLGRALLMGKPYPSSITSSLAEDSTSRSK
ncbi:MAG: hypothetical protein KC656_00480 [Myxococcales bacterium]|nr:hypothetical protein [Myxococcales bacterium]